MLKKMRIRFICITMAIVLVMLCVIFGLVLRFTRQNLERESVAMMETVAADPLQLNWPGISSSRLPYFTVRISLWGDIRVNGESYYDLSDTAFLSKIVNAALSGDDGTGLIPEYSLRYYRTVSNGSGYIIFADVSSEGATLRSLTRNCVFIGLGSLAVFFLLSLLLARWSARPAEKAWDQQRQFVSDASHELKTPLTVILTNAEMLDSPDFGEEEKRRFLKNIVTMSHRMQTLVEGLLSLARAENGRMREKFETFDLSGLVTDALLPFEPLFYEKGLELKSEIAPNVRCLGSQNHLRQVTEILLDNAQKYSAPGEVTVSLSTKGRGHCLLSVSTPGEPMSAADCEAVFRRFYRKDSARSGDGSYGLGLAIAKSIVEEHRGKIWCESGEGKNTFYVQLPVI
ncbi:MAG: HAMP domain-containing histidine kinase [Oscillospiraceae bacterium]|nr:HAMP domain-containing histidine kinase [Oscillospiraceae bacterium]